LAAAAALALTVLQPILWGGPAATLQQDSAPQKVLAAQPQAAQPSPETKPPDASTAKLSWPAHEPLERSKEIAYSALFRAWGAEYGGADACRQAKTLGLDCRSGRGGLEVLRQFNRPVVMALSDEQGREFFATMTALDANSASYSVGSQTRIVAHSDLAAHWSGRYTVLLRLPAEAHEQIRVGNSGPAVQWLGSQLALAQGRAPPASAKEQVFDEALLQQVKKFQVAQGLVPDGAVGPQTLLRLSSVADQTGPKLWREPRGK
ncbi:MAG: peptidoglycan-binding protein, partial [Pseudomonadota bacterium]